MLTHAPPAGTVCVGLSAQLCSDWVFFDFFEHILNIQFFCAAPSCPVAVMHKFSDVYRYWAQVWVISIHLTPNMARQQPRTKVLGGLECPRLLPARSGYVVGGALQAT
jgi:hypothetical protein